MKLRPSLERQILATPGVVVRGGKTKRRRGEPADDYQRRAFVEACSQIGLPGAVPEYRFHPIRKWRFDWAWPSPSLMLALEIDGGAWVGGRHTRGKGFIADQEKRNAAVLLGWRVLHCVPADVKSGAVFELLKRAVS